MNPVLQAVEAARLLGRWSLIAERHGGGCSCCPGLGDVSMAEVDRRVLAWLRERHSLGGCASVAALLRDCVERKALLEPALLRDLAEALDDLERIQAGL